MNSDILGSTPEFVFETVCVDEGGNRRDWLQNPFGLLGQPDEFDDRAFRDPA